MLQKKSNIAELVGATFEIESEYPEWPYNPNSQIRNLFEKVHQENTIKKLKSSLCMRGLSVRIRSKMPELDAISFGPDILTSTPR